MKIQFVFAPPIKKPLAGQLSEGIWPPMGILYLASYIRLKYPEAKLNITDGLITGFQGALDEVGNFDPDVLCISYVTLVAKDAYKFINKVKSMSPDVLAITGGIHATTFPEEAFEMSVTDINVIGEGEETLSEIVGHLGSGLSGHLPEIKGISYRDDGNSVKQTPIRPYNERLDDLPFPAWDLIDRNNYRGWFLFQKKPEASIFMSRGCPFNCTYCSNKVWKCSSPKLRLRSPASIADEIEWLHSEFGFNEFFDNSDELNNNMKNAINICKEIEARNLNVNWKTQMRAAPISEELVESMKRAGCWYVHLGIESANPRTLKGIRKSVTRDQVIQACELLKKYGIKILGLFMFNNVWEENGELVFEDIADSRETLKFAKSLVKMRLLDFIACSITTPYPGSELYEIAVRHKLIKEKYFKQWDKWLREDYFIMSLPGVQEKHQARLRTLAYRTQFWCMLKSGNIGLKDVGYYLHKAAAFLKNEIMTNVGRKASRVK